MNPEETWRLLDNLQHLVYTVLLRSNRWCIEVMERSMTPSKREERPIVLRDIERIAEMRDVEELQKEVWGMSDRDIVPITQLVAAKAAGGVLIGAFEGDRMVGFVYGFVGYERGVLSLHSHMLAVRPAYQNRQLGYRLKLAQRDRALEQGITRITWTFDPLQSLNAHFNFGKLGVLADEYKVNFYGEETSSFLHRNIGGTDRLWVTWLLDSRRVKERLEHPITEKGLPSEWEALPPLVRVGSDDAPVRGDPAESLARDAVLIEIPAHIRQLQQDRPSLAAEWRQATRWAFTEALAAGYLVQEFYRLAERDRPRGAYLLVAGKTLEDFLEN